MAVERYKFMIRLVAVTVGISFVVQKVHLHHVSANDKTPIKPVAYLSATEIEKRAGILMRKFVANDTDLNLSTELQLMSRNGSPNPVYESFCTDAKGAYLLTTMWDAKTGNLAAIKNNVRHGGDISHIPLDQHAAVNTALYWLHFFGINIRYRDWITVGTPSLYGENWFVKMQSGSALAYICVDQRTWDLVSMDIREGISPGRAEMKATQVSPNDLSDFALKEPQFVD